MTNRKTDDPSRPAKGQEKVQELRPPAREKINQGQQFDEMQRQEKNPDGTQQE